ncbi:MAG: hypothetical protein ACOYLT_02515 [Flavobacterium sp.]|uniref:hypothetical protein n=1 Tax=Flavobacterium sp. TaxID=239 RepID=UPI003BE95272
MKNSILFVIMMLNVVSYSQEKVIDTIKKKEKKFSIYYGGNVSFNDDFNLNKKLRNSNLPELKTSIPDFVFGLNYFWKKYSGDAEFGFLYSKSDKGANETKQAGFNSRLRVHYNLVDREKFAFTTGLSVAYTGNEYDIFNKNNTIDLNDLEPNNNSGHVNFTNSMLYFGPSSSFYFFRKSDWNVKLNLGYEFAITRGRYHSEFGSILNNNGEAGNNRFVLGIVFN